MTAKRRERLIKVNQSLVWKEKSRKLNWHTKRYNENEEYRLKEKARIATAFVRTLLKAPEYKQFNIVKQRMTRLRDKIELHTKVVEEAEIELVKLVFEKKKLAEICRAKGVKVKF